MVYEIIKIVAGLFCSQVKFQDPQGFRIDHTFHRVACFSFISQLHQQHRPLLVKLCTCRQKK